MINIKNQLILILFFSSISGYVKAENIHNVIPEGGYVPNKEAAIKIAVAVWEPIYGENKIADEAPYNVELKDDIWVVTGSLPKGWWKGGVALIWIEKKTGKVLRVSHGK